MQALITPIKFATADYNKKALTMEGLTYFKIINHIIQLEYYFTSSNSASVTFSEPLPEFGCALP